MAGQRPRKSLRIRRQAAGLVKTVMQDARLGKAVELDKVAPVVERFGLQGFGAHSADAEYVLVDSIEPRLYLATRMVMDLSRNKIGN